MAEDKGVRARGGFAAAGLCNAQPSVLQFERALDA
jgi:hypothetical protein